MSKQALNFLMITSIVFGMDAAGHAQETDAGKSEFQSSCATCHGIDGKGNGPLSQYLKATPADLTVLAKKNGGVFPLSDVYDAIYGIKTIVTHGSRDMPTWGLRYDLDSIKALNPKPSDRAMSLSYDSEALVRSRILAVVDYLNRIQQK